jgi:beta-glucosidase
MPRALGQVPLSYDALPTGRPKGGAYTSRYVDQENTPLFPFGYGLSYTQFSYGTPTLDSATLRPDGMLHVTVRVTNEGARKGAAVPQLYVHDELASVSRPMRQLKGFARVMLDPGETRSVTFTLTPQDLAFVRRDMTWGTEPGAYTLWVGGDSTATQSARFTLAGE